MDVALIPIFANHLALVVCIIYEGEVGFQERKKGTLGDPITL